MTLTKNGDKPFNSKGNTKEIPLKRVATRGSELSNDFITQSEPLETSLAIVPYELGVIFQPKILLQTQQESTPMTKNSDENTTRHHFSSKTEASINKGMHHNHLLERIMEICIAQLETLTIFSAFCQILTFFAKFINKTFSDTGLKMADVNY